MVFCFCYFFPREYKLFNFVPCGSCFNWSLFQSFIHFLSAFDYLQSNGILNSFWSCNRISHFTQLRITERKDTYLHSIKADETVEKAFKKTFTLSLISKDLFAWEIYLEKNIFPQRKNSIGKWEFVREIAFDSLEMIGKWIILVHWRVFVVTILSVH